MLYNGWMPYSFEWKHHGYHIYMLQLRFLCVFGNEAMDKYYCKEAGGCMDGSIEMQYLRWSVMS